MSHFNETAKLLKLTADDLIHRPMDDIVNSMDEQAQEDYVNSVRTHAEVAEAIVNKRRNKNNLVFFNLCDIA